MTQNESRFAAWSKEHRVDAVWLRWRTDIAWLIHGADVLVDTDREAQDGSGPVRRMEPADHRRQILGHHPLDRGSSDGPEGLADGRRVFRHLLWRG